MEEGWLISARRKHRSHRRSFALLAAVAHFAAIALFAAASELSRAIARFRRRLPPRHCPPLRHRSLLLTFPRFRHCPLLRHMSLRGARASVAQILEARKHVAFGCLSACRAAAWSMALELPCASNGPHQLAQELGLHLHHGHHFCALLRSLAQAL